MSDAVAPHAAAARTSRMGLLHAIVVGAAVLGFLFIVLWAGEAVGFAPTTHRFVAIFAGDGEPASVSVLGRGLPFALGLGAAAGALLALFSNLFAFLDR